MTEQSLCSYEPEYIFCISFQMSITLTIGIFRLRDNKKNKIKYNKKNKAMQKNCILILLCV